MNLINFDVMIKLSEIKEEWKPIPGYEGTYEASTHGRIRRVEGFTANGKKWKGKIMRLNVNEGGYQYVVLTKNGIEKYWIVSRLIALSFHQNPYNKPEVNHKDGVKTNNFSYNLEWNTEKENINHAFATGLHKAKAEHPLAKLVLDTQTGIYYGFLKEAAEAKNINYSTLRSMMQGASPNRSGLIYA